MKNQFAQKSITVLDVGGHSFETRVILILSLWWPFTKFQKYDKHSGSDTLDFLNFKRNYHRSDEIWSKIKSTLEMLNNSQSNRTVTDSVLVWSTHFIILKKKKAAHFLKLRDSLERGHLSWCVSHYLKRMILTNA